MLGRKKKGNTDAKEDNKNVRVMTDFLCDSDDGGGEDAIQSWRIFRIMSEFVAGFEILRKYGLAATFFGSARCGVGDEIYDAAKELAGKLVEREFAIITGGGPGIMEAANVGAYDAGGHSVGMNIKLPSEQKLNPYTTASEDFHFFFTRKVMLSFASEVYIYFPGGFGTLDECFELLTLVQTGKISKIPIILYGKEYWGPFVEWVEHTLYEKYATISKEDMELFHVVDSVDEALTVISKTVDKQTPRQR